MAQHAAHGSKALDATRPKKSTKKGKTADKSVKKSTKIKTKGKIVKSTKIVTTITPTTLTPRDLVRAAVQPGGVPASGRYHGEKVFIAAIYDYVTNAIGHHALGMTLEQFKRWLVEQNRLGYLVLARADLVGAMDRAMVTRSEIESYGATFHFVLADSVK
jgi:hypothetical protein